MKRVGLTAALLVLVVLTTSCETTPKRNLPGTMVTTPMAYPPGVVLATVPSAPDASTGSVNMNMQSKTLLMSDEPVGWADFPAARVLRLDKTGRVAMVDAGLSEGLGLAEKLYTVRDGQATGVLRTIEIFDNVTICQASRLPNPGNAGIRVGDLIATSFRGAYVRSSYDDYLLRKRIGVSGGGGLPTEEELVSLQERMAEVREQGVLSEAVVKSALESRKEIEQAWKEALREVQLQNPTP